MTEDAYDTSARPAEPPPGGTAEQHDPIGLTGDGAAGRVCVLVVGDDGALIEACTSILRLEGYAVTACTPEANARQVASGLRYDIVILDGESRLVPGVQMRAPHRDRQDPPFGPAALAALAALKERSWPGNVREFQNVIAHAVVLLSPGAEIQARDIPAEGTAETPLRALLLPLMLADGADSTYHGARERLLAEFERGYLSWLLARSAGNMSRAARVAGVDRTTLYRLMEKHGLHRQTVLGADL